MNTRPVRHAAMRLELIDGHLRLEEMPPDQPMDAFGSSKHSLKARRPECGRAGAHGRIWKCRPSGLTNEKNLTSAGENTGEAGAQIE